jgi:hypothetical protein
MATFKVGQRVKRVVDPMTDPVLLRTDVPLGSTGVVNGLDRDGDCFVMWDHAGQQRLVFASTIAPLTDSKADAFIESLKRLKPYEEPVAPRKVIA